ncbi:MAG: helix-turn-helix domain-containing protein [Oscillospiraceae bacterium]|nr:helix-turn-helix domain-containing protein [Oscillospiraceae bacterium]
MPKDILEVLLNPVRMRVLQLFRPGESGAGGQMTANEICEQLSDIPRTTLYRHIGVLIDADVLDIVSERKVRGSVERTLALNMSEFEKLRGNNVENVPQLALRYLMVIYAKFEKYFRTHERIAEKDTMFFTSAILMLNDQEFEGFLTEITAVFDKYSSKGASEGCKSRDISIICAPPEEMRKTEGG